MSSLYLSSHPGRRTSPSRAAGTSQRGRKRRRLDRRKLTDIPAREHRPDGPTAAPPPRDAAACCFVFPDTSTRGHSGGDGFFVVPPEMMSRNLPAGTRQGTAWVLSNCHA